MQAFLAISQEGKDLLYPKLDELILGAVAFFILFGFMYKWVVPRLNKMLEARRDKIQGDMEKAEQAKGEAEKVLNDYRKQLSNARDEANRIIEEARKTAEAMRRDLQEKAEHEYQQQLGRAQEDIRAERDRVFQELRAQIGQLSVELAARVVGESLDRDRQLDLVDRYIQELGSLAPAGNGNRRGGEES